MKNFLKEKKFVLALTVIIFISLFLRLYNLGEKSFSADEFLGVNTAYGYLKTGEWRRWDFNLEKPFEDNEYFKTFFDFDLWNDGSDTYTRAWFYNWQTSQSLRFLPDSQEWSYRLISVMWGVLAVLAVYWVSFKFTKNRTLSLIAALLMAFSLDGIEFSRRMRMYSMFMPVFLVFAWVAFNFFESNMKSRFSWLNKINDKLKLNFIFFVPLVLMGLLSMHLHLLTANFVFVALVYFMVMAFIRYKEDKNIKNHYTIYSLAGLIFVGASFQIGGALTASLNWQQHFSYLNNSFFDYGNWVLAGLFLIMGGIYLLKTKKKEGVFIMANYWVILFLAIFLWDRNVGAQYLFFIKPFQIIMIAAGIWWIASFLRDNLKKYKQEVYWISMAVMLLAVINFAYFFQAENTYTQTAQSENPNYKKVFGYVLNHKNEKDVLITRAFRNFYWQGSKINVFSMGGERAIEGEKKITLEKLTEIIKNNPSGWIVYSENDENFISKDAQKYIEKDMTQISNLQTRGPIKVYHWGELKK